MFIFQKLSIPAIGCPQPLLDAVAAYSEVQYELEITQDYIDNASDYEQAAEHKDREAIKEALDKGVDRNKIKARAHRDEHEIELQVKRTQVAGLQARARELWNTLVDVAHAHRDEWVGNLLDMVDEATAEYDTAAQAFLEARRKRDTLINIAEQVAAYQPHDKRAPGISVGTGLVTGLRGSLEDVIREDSKHGPSSRVKRIVDTTEPESA